MAAPMPTLFCPGNRWMQVEFVLAPPFRSQRWYAPPEVEVRWQWFSLGFPWYRSGAFNGTECITFGLGIFTSLEVNPSVDTTVTWEECQG